RELEAGAGAGNGDDQGRHARASAARAGSVARVRPGVIVVGLLLAAHRLAALAAGLGLLALALDRGLLVVRAALHLLEEALFLHPLLEGFERGLDLVLDDLDPHEDLRAAAVFTCAAAR